MIVWKSILSPLSTESKQQKGKNGKWTGALRWAHRCVAGFSGARVASRAPENCASGAGAPRPPGGHVSMSGRGAPRHQGTKARRHQGSHPGGTRASASPKLHTSEPLNCASTHPPLLSLNEDENKGSLNWRQCTVTVWIRGKGARLRCF